MDSQDGRFDRKQYGQDLAMTSAMAVFTLQRELRDRFLPRSGDECLTIIELDVARSETCIGMTGDKMRATLRLALHLGIEAFDILGPDPYDTRRPARTRYKLCTFSAPGRFDAGDRYPIFRG